jgi:hypothetical protein
MRSYRHTNEKVFAVAGLKFGDKFVGQIVVICKALYGLVSSARGGIPTSQTR